MLELWPHCGYQLLEPDDDDCLKITDAFLRAYWERPEVAPIEESCSAELTLHRELVGNPRRTVIDQDFATFADPDAVENYRVVLDFRDRLVAAGTIESAYLRLFREGAVTIPPIFIDQMAQILARHIIGSSRDPFRARAAELLFREQQASLMDGAILLGDKETVNILGVQSEKNGGFGAMGELLVEGGIRPRQVELDVLLEDTAAERYWPENEKFDTVLDLTFARPGLDALCRVLELWVHHLLQAEVNIQPVPQINDERWVWHIGLDVEATALLNDLYEAKDIDEARLENVLSLFSLEFKDPSLMRPDIAGRPVYLALCRSDDGRVRMKPQNLVINLPLAPKS
ncbi:MAG: hypothetical protein CMF67_07350 [Magnetovibrio sp.]|nr:hypothetical protein [Magnetovibrio sp.]